MSNGTAPTPVNRPGVEVEQILTTTETAQADPLLPAFIFGPCWQIVEALESDGTLDSDAYYGVYDQHPVAITQSSFPDPRNNILNLDIDETEVDPYLWFLSSLGGLPTTQGYGDAFLMAMNIARRAAILCGTVVPAPAGINLDGTNLVISLDNATPAVTTNDIVVNFSADGMSAADIVAAINSAAGQTIAYALVDSAAAYGSFLSGASVTNATGTSGLSAIAIVSPTYGASSSVTIRAGGSANYFLDIGDDGVAAPANTTYNQRVTGAGFWALEDNDGDTTAPWIEFSRGRNYEWTTTWPADPTTIEISPSPGAAGGSAAGIACWFVDEQDTYSEYTVSLASAVTFGQSGTVYLKKYDLVYADGIQVKSGKVMKVEAGKFRMGTTDVAASTVENGLFTNEVLTGVEVETLSDNSPFAPRNLWFQAKYLDFEETIPLNDPGYLLGNVDGQAATVGIAAGTANAAGVFALTGTNLYFTVTKDGVVQSQQTVTFPAPAPPTYDYDDMVGVVAYLNGTGIMTDATAEDVDMPGTMTALTVLDPADGLTGGTLSITIGVTTHDQTVAAVAPNPANTIEDILLALEDRAAVPDADHYDQIVWTAEEQSGAGAGTYIMSFQTVGEGEATGSIVLTGNTTTNELGFTTGGGFTANYTLDNPGARLRIKTAATGSDQAVTIASTGTSLCNSLLGLSTSTDTTGTGSDIEFTGAAASLAAASGVGWAALDAPLASGASCLSVTYFDASGAEATAKWDSGGIAGNNVDGITHLLSLLNDSVNWSASNPFNFAAGSEPFTIDNEQQITMTATATAMQGAWAYMMLDTGSTWAAALGLATGTTKYRTTEALTAAKLRWTMNDDPHVYEVIAQNDSIEDFITKIEDETGWAMGVKGTGLANIAVPTPAETKFALISFLQGLASEVALEGTEADLLTASTGDEEHAIRALGLCTYTVAATPSADFVAGVNGTGRPDPDAYIDASGNLNVGAEILRDVITGYPYTQGEAGSAALYIAYKALRKDVSPQVVDAAGLPDQAMMVGFTDTSDLTADLAPITEDNPLGLGFYFAMINAPQRKVYGMGVAEVDANEPEGTQFSYMEILEFIEAYDVYGLVPLTRSPMVHQMCYTHVDSMSEPENKGERHVIIAPTDPDREADDILASGSGGESSASLQNVFVTDENVSAAVINAGLTPAAITYANECFLEVTIETATIQEIRRYSVQVVNNTMISLRTTFATGENADGFYSTTDLALSLTSVEWSLNVRGASLVVAGSSPPRIDKDKMAIAAALAGAGFSSRRVVSLFPDTIVSQVTGTSQSLESYYAAACIAGMTSYQRPDQPFTEYPITGLVGVIGSDDTFKESQLNQIAGGGRYILIHEGDENVPVKCRHQLTTDMTSAETQEYSVLRALDTLSKAYRRALKNKIGKRNITAPLLDELMIDAQAIATYMSGAGGIVNYVKTNNIIQDPNYSRGIIVDVTADTKDPCNRIRVQIHV
jgi:hypothetical protein